MTRRPRPWQAPDPVPERTSTPPRAGDPTPLGPLLDRILGGFGAPPADALATLFSRWPDLAGPHLAAHGAPAAVDGGTLVVVVEDPLWATEWRYRQGEVLRRCDEALGAGIVERVEVRVRRP